MWPINTHIDRPPMEDIIGKKEKKKKEHGFLGSLSLKGFSSNRGLEKLLLERNPRMVQCMHHLFPPWFGSLALI